MRNSALYPNYLISVAAAAGLLSLAPRPVQAHCDTLDGPVVREAQAALRAGDVTPVLKWVGPDQEAEIRQAFAAALEVRGLSPEALTLADRFFFETLVRVHRETEGAPFTGLKPAGTKIDPAILASEAALRTGEIERLVASIANEVERGLRARYARARRARARASHSVEEGREYVAAYVDLLHHVEALSAVADRATDAPGEHHLH